MTEPPHPGQTAGRPEPGTPPTEAIAVSPPAPSTAVRTQQVPAPIPERHGTAGAPPQGSTAVQPRPQPQPKAQPQPGTATAVQPEVPGTGQAEVPGTGQPEVPGTGQPAPRATVPVETVPAPPGGGAPPSSPPAPHSPPPRPGGDSHERAARIGVGLVGLSVLLLQAGLALRFGGDSYWSLIPLWSAFATVAALLGLLAFAHRLPGGGRLRSGAAWKVAAGGLTGLAVFWLLVVLPRVDTDRGFVLTAALACLGVALWIAPGRTG